jgi:hypothetical protein
MVNMRDDAKITDIIHKINCVKIRCKYINSFPPPKAPAGVQKEEPV